MDPVSGNFMDPVSNKWLVLERLPIGTRRLSIQAIFRCYRFSNSSIVRPEKVSRRSSYVLEFEFQNLLFEICFFLDLDFSFCFEFSFPKFGFPISGFRFLRADQQLSLKFAPLHGAECLSESKLLK